MLSAFLRVRACVRACVRQGYKSFNHLPLQVSHAPPRKIPSYVYSVYLTGRVCLSICHPPAAQLGFDRFTGFLGGAEDHFAIKRWEGNCPLTPANDTYSAGEQAFPLKTDISQF
jgi:hypothetical protein